MMHKLDDAIHVTSAFFTVVLQCQNIVEFQNLLPFGLLYYIIGILIDLSHCLVARDIFGDFLLQD